MWTRVLLLAGSLVLATQAFSGIDQESLVDPNSDFESTDSDTASKLDPLFSALKLATDPETASSLENDIINIWLESGSDTVNLLMDWTIKAIDARNHPLALDYLDRIVTLQPDYAEGWNKRAAVHFLVDDYSKAIADIEQTLALEPRHFGAMSGLGRIMREIGDNGNAMIAFRRALDIDPHLENVADALKEIEAEVAGQEI